MKTHKQTFESTFINQSDITVTLKWDGQTDQDGKLKVAFAVEQEGKETYINVMSLSPLHLPDSLNAIETALFFAGNETEDEDWQSVASTLEEQIENSSRIVTV